MYTMYNHDSGIVDSFNIIKNNNFLKFNAYINQN